MDECNYSLVSVANVASVAPQRCFLAGALFKIPDNCYVPAARLQKDGFIYGASGELLQVVAVHVHPERNEELVELSTADAVLTVTATHRVVVERAHGKQTLQARSLRPGESVFCSGDRVAVLRQVRSFIASVEVVEATFNPDNPVEALNPPPGSIQSKGHGWSKVRRGRPSQSGPLDLISIPETDDGFK